MSRAPEWIVVEASQASAYRVELSAQWPDQWWPFSGWLALRFRVTQADSTGDGSLPSALANETLVGLVRVAVESLHADTQQFVRSELEFPVRLVIVPTPPRECALFMHT